VTLLSTSPGAPGRALTLPFAPVLSTQLYCAGHLSVQLNGCDGPPFGPGFVIITAPGNPLHTFFTSLSFVGFVVPGCTSTTLIFLGVTPPTVAVAPSLIPVPVTSRKNCPVSCLSSLQLVTVAISGVPPVPGVPAALHVNVMHCRHPCSLPNAHPAGWPVTGVTNPRLVPPGPVTKITNVFPAFALPKLKCASSRFAFMIVKSCALIRFAGFATSTANTDVTVPIMFADPGGFAPGTNCVNVKHAPVISTSCNRPHGPLDGVTEITTGALVPNANEHVVVLVNAPNTLLSPVENVVVIVIVDTPPQHVAGNADVDVGPNDALTGIVALTKLQFTGVTLVNTIVDSAVPSPFVSHASDAAVDTVFPGRCNGIPVSDVNP